MVALTGPSLVGRSRCTLSLSCLCHRILNGIIWNLDTLPRLSWHSCWCCPDFRWLRFTHRSPLTKRVWMVPIGAVHGEDDRARRVEDTHDMIQTINRSGGRPDYTELPSVGRRARKPVSRNSASILDWRFTQRCCWRSKHAKFNSTRSPVARFRIKHLRQKP